MPGEMTSYILTLVTAALGSDSVRNIGFFFLLVGLHSVVHDSIILGSHGTTYQTFIYCAMI